MISLQFNTGFKWNKHGNTFVKGYMENIKDTSWELSQTIRDIPHLVNKLKEQRGFFSIVIETEEFIFAAVDRVRSIPLFYGEVGNQFYLSDNARWIRNQFEEKKVDKISENEFLLTGYVTGNSTLHPGIKQIQAGEYIVFDKVKKILTPNYYFKFSHGNYFEMKQDELIEELDRVHLKVFNRLIDSLNGRTALIPLSGGYDSRLLVIMLKRLGYENVICFTYGKENNKEAIISKYVAEKLGYKWIFIPYTKNKWSNWYNSKSKSEYFNYADGLSSIPLIQDVIAVDELKMKGLVPENSIVIPGHTGDFIAGGHIPKEFIHNKDVSSNLLIDVILENHYNLWKVDFKQIYKEKIFNIIEKRDTYSNEMAADLYEQWVWSERQAKFICNSLRVYDFYDFEWRLPLWEREIIEFWERVPLESRVGRNLYIEYTKQKQSEFNSLNKSLSSSRKIVKELLKSIPFIYKYRVAYSTKNRFKEHPLEWNAIIDRAKYSEKKLKRAININSILTSDYIDSGE